MPELSSIGGSSGLRAHQKMLKLTNINYGLSRPMIPEKRIIRRIQSGGCAIHCQDCSISQLCIPFTLNEHELDQLDNIIERKSLFRKGKRCLKQVMN